MLSHPPKRVCARTQVSNGVCTMRLMHDTHSSPLRQNLRRLIFLRACIVWAVGVAAITVQWGLAIELRLLPVGAVSACFAAVIALSWWRLLRPWPVLELEMLVHLGIDVAFFSALLYFTGGAGNPFVSLYLLPVVIAATTLPAAYAMVLTALAVLAYSLLLVYYVPLMPESHVHEAGGFGLHVVGMWVNFLVCAALVLWIVARMAGAIRERDKQLADAREKTMRDDKVLSLGLMAAGAAHELATPISTMSVLIDEMEQSAPPGGILREDFQTLKNQVRHCRSVIQGLAASAGQARSAHVRRLELRPFVDETIERWRLLRPGVSLTARFESLGASPPIMADETLSSTLTSLLNNAADASPAGIELETRCDHNHVTLEILDHGEGISEDVLRHAGRAMITTKPAGKGWGIGLLLANATIERLGGSIVLLKRPGGGSCTRITLPLVALAPGAK
jgi:two-component system, sensor histidine kinase RegB